MSEENKPAVVDFRSRAKLTQDQVEAIARPAPEVQTAPVCISSQKVLEEFTQMVGDGDVRLLAVAAVNGAGLPTYIQTAPKTFHDLLAQKYAVERLLDHVNRTIRDCTSGERFGVDEDEDEES